MPKPKTQTAKYWQARFTQLEAAQHRYGLDTYKEIEPAFDKAQREIKAQIEAWYGRYANNNGVSLREAKRHLSAGELKELKWDIKEYIQYGRENAIDGRWVKELENASAKFHISRLEGLLVRIQQSAEKAFGSELDAVDRLCRNAYTEGYYKSLFELQKGTGVGFNISAINQNKLDKLVVKPWTVDGRNFSDRIWGSKKQLLDNIHKSLVRNCATSKSPDAAIKEISKQIGVSKAQAGRLIMTEQAYFSSVATKDSYKEMGLEKYEICATLDSKTSEICQDMDGEVFDLKDYEPGSTAPPFHPNCRTTTVPWFDDFLEGEERAARGDDGNAYYVPADITYKEWAKKSIVVRYEGTPDDWVKGKPTMSMRNINPENKKDNCVNCSIAYEMHRRGYPDIIAGDSLKQLRENPFIAWENPELVEPYEGESIIDFVERAFMAYGKEARIQLALLRKIPGYIPDDYIRPGHMINAEYRDGKLVFVDSQARKLYYRDDISFLDKYEAMDTLLCRVDNLELSTIGAKLCKKYH